MIKKLFKRIILAGLVVFGLLSGVAWADTVVYGGISIIYDSSCNKSQYYAAGGPLCVDTSTNIVYRGTGTGIQSVAGDISDWLSRSGTDTRLLDPSGNPVFTCKEGDGGCATRCDPNAATLAAGACVGSSQCNNVTFVPPTGTYGFGCDPSGNFTFDTSGNKTYGAGSFSITDITGQTDDTTPATTATAVLAQSGSLIESTIDQIIKAVLPAPGAIGGTTPAAITATDGSFNTSVKIPATTNTNLNSLIMVRDPSDNKLKTTDTLNGWQVEGDTASKYACFDSSKKLVNDASCASAVIVLAKVSGLGTNVATALANAANTIGGSVIGVSSNSVVDASKTYMVQTVNANSYGFRMNNRGWDKVDDASPMIVDAVAMSMMSGFVFNEHKSDSHQIGFRDSSDNAYLRDPSTNVITGPFKNVYTKNAAAKRIWAIDVISDPASTTGGLAWLVSLIAIDATVDSKLYGSK